MMTTVSPNEPGHLRCSEGHVDAFSGHKTQKNFIQHSPEEKVRVVAKCHDFIHTHNASAACLVRVFTKRTNVQQLMC